jgi:small GTP-binding protein
MQRHFLFKILIAGDASVGKTSLLRRYVNDMFDESSIMTVGVDFFLKKVEINDDNKKTIAFSFQLWDLGGQERFRHLMPSYVMGARAALLLIDLTKEPNMNSILEWVNIIRMHDINLPIILVGTKMDLEDCIAVDDTAALAIKETFKMIDYFKTSAKTGYNVAEVFTQLAKQLLNLYK